MTVEISLENLIRIYKMAALGKLMSGLIHNLNGPLQNIGIDIEMMAHLMMTSEEKDTEEIFGPRLRRIEGEFDAINQLIRTTSMKANMESASNEYRKLNDLLDQEFSFLKANLYFKHNVRKNFDLEDDLPAVTRFAEDMPLALSWFVQTLVEELEREKIPALSVTTRSGHDIVELRFMVEGSDLSESFRRAIEADRSHARVIRVDDRDIGVILSATLLQQAGAAIEIKNAPSKNLVILRLPVIKKDALH